MRVLITGSRNWCYPAAVYGALLDLSTEFEVRPRDMVVVHGAAPGADIQAEDKATLLGMKTESYPADWSRPCDAQCYHEPRERNGRPYCPMAGHLRNQYMVDLGADICLAFPLKDSRGTWDCVRRAKKAGIPVRIVSPDEYGDTHTRWVDG